MRLFFPYSLLLCFIIFSGSNEPTGDKQKSPLLSKNIGESSAVMAKDLDENWYANAINYLKEEAYALHPSDEDKSVFVAINSKNGLRFDINSNGYKVERFQHDKKSVYTHFEIASITKGTGNYNLPSDYSISGNGNLLVYENQELAIEYANTELGMRQNFLLKKRLPGTENPRVNIRLDDRLSYSLDQTGGLACYTGKQTSRPFMYYDKLKVWDANGKVLPSYMALNKTELSLVVDDKNAVYPIMIDPLNHTPEWATSADGILPGLLTNLQLQVDALYGYNVAGLGDVNGDGFDDVAIGAPGAIDIISSSTIVGAGAVFVYFGSAAGLPATPSKVLRGNSSLNALFGYSISSGNLVGNSRKDIIVGAPGETYTAAVGGIPATASVSAGKVYVFRGEDLTAASPTPLLSVYLDGSGFFSRVTLSNLISNVNVKALFGFSVAAAGDMNGDGLDELVVGSPGYAGLALLSARSGAAFVYYSNTLVANTNPVNPVKLTAPTAGLLGIPLLTTTDGLLFGFSVDGAGDFNKDGNQDVVVGAPAGVTLDPTHLLAGSAYIFRGNGTGINTTYSNQLKATGTLSNLLPNLFGYTVKGVTNAAGVRNGNVLVAAPLGNLLSNVVGGLKLKTGSINLFIGANNHPATIDPAQAIPSPAGNSLLSILAGQNIEISSLFGTSIDNMLDVNCDGINDIIAGEPLSSGVGLISANAVGGSAHIFLGKIDGTFISTPYWTLSNSVSYNGGVNAGSLLGYSVAGAKHVRGAMQGVRSIVGAPGAALDFSSGIFELGGTLGTLLNFTAGSNGLGKAYMFGFEDCGIIYNPDINVTRINTQVTGNVSTNDKVPAGTMYGTPVPAQTNASGGVINMNPDGSYDFIAIIPGVYHFTVPVCLPGQTTSCKMVELKITVLDNGNNNPPIANTDIATTLQDNSVIVKSLANDKCTGVGCTLNAGSVTIVNSPLHGTVTVDNLTGNITYTPNAGYVGHDTLSYQVCANGVPVQCASAQQFYTVYATTSPNSTSAADDFYTTLSGMSVGGNVSLNDTDPEGHTQSVQPQNTTVAGKGTLTLDAGGNFDFEPAVGFTGPVEFAYSTCDNGSPSACAGGTLHLFVFDGGLLAVNLNSFSYTIRDCAVNLTWKTLLETNLSRFVIQHSSDGNKWKDAASLHAKGNATTGFGYSYQHRNPANGSNYYRLAIFEEDGTVAYSVIIKPVINCMSTSMIARPNPFVNKISINYLATMEEIATIQLHDNTGRLMATKMQTVTEGANTIELLSLEKLPKGIYLISVATKNNRYQQKLIK
ncbi:MAG: Ig-like domain-containing protein [Bacteroidota bacterium]